jgi:hypothetical protein
MNIVDAENIIRDARKALELARLNLNNLDSTELQGHVQIRYTQIRDKADDELVQSITKLSDITRSLKTLRIIKEAKEGR